MTSFDPNKLTTLLLQPQQSEPDDLIAALAPVGFANPEAAASCLRRLAAGQPPKSPFAKGDCDPRFILNLLEQLSTAAHPDHTLVSFENFVQKFAATAALYKMLAAEPRSPC